MYKKPSFTLLSAIAAALGYGAWAGFVNMEHGTQVMIMAGVVQGVYAFLSTLSITYVAQSILMKTGGGVKGLLISFFASFSVMALIPVVIHNLAGTPDILESVLPGLLWGSVYVFGILQVFKRKIEST